MPATLPESTAGSPPRLAGYRVLSEVGTGGMGTVYRARELATGRLVAVKFPAGGPESAAALRREAACLARLDHPVFPRSLGLVKAGRTVALVQEYIPGQTAQGHVREWSRWGLTLPWERVSAWAEQLLDGLAHAHARGVVHRDISPANLMIDGDDEEARVRLIDLGLSDTPGGRGSAPYLAPELWGEASEASPAGDIYALGCTLYHLLTGQPPFPGAPQGEVCLAHATAPRPLLRRRRPDAPVALEVLLENMMAVAPARRGSAAVLLRWLRSALPQTPPQARTALAVEVARPSLWSLLAGLFGQSVSRS